MDIRTFRTLIDVKVYEPDVNGARKNKRDGNHDQGFTGL